MKSYYLSTAVLLAAATMLGCGKKDAASTTAGESVATVNGEPISSAEYHDLLERKTTVLVSTPQGVQLLQTYGSVGIQGLRDVIDRKLVFQLAKEEGVLPTEKDITDEIDNRTKRTPNYQNLMITQGGLTVPLLRQDVMFDLARERLVTKGVTVGMPEVDQYIKENPQDFSDPARASLLIVVVSDVKKKADVDKALASGQTFQTVATRYSEYPQAQQSGGAFPETEVSRMPKILQDLVAKTPKLKASDWIQDGKNWAKFYVKDKVAAKPITITPEIKKEVQRQLAMRRGQTVNDIAGKLQQRVLTSDIKVMPAHLNLYWTKMVEQLKAASASQGSGAAGGPAGRAPAGGPPAPGGATPGGTAPGGTAPGGTTPGASPK